MEASRLRVLLVEDSTADAELILRALRDYPDPYEYARVASGEALRRALAEFRPDVVLSDFSMPGFSGQEALTIVREHDPWLPFLFVSGTIGEELAIDALQRGAVDYVLKDNLRRLAPAVERALRNADEQQQRREMERALRESEERFRSIVENSQDWIWETDPEGVLTYSNRAVERILGYRVGELLGRDILEHMHPEDRGAIAAMPVQDPSGDDAWSGRRQRWLACDGSERVMESAGDALRDEVGRLRGFRGINHDLTGMQRQQDRIRQLARLHAVLGGIGNSLLRIPDRERLLEDVCRVAVNDGGFDAAAVGLPAEGDGKGLRVASCCGERRMLDCLRHLDALGDGMQALRPGVRVLGGAGALFLSDLEGGEDGELAPQVREPLVAAGICAMAVLPLGDPPWGVLGLYSREPLAFDRDERELLERLRTELDFGVDFIAKGERLEFLAYHNPVSGLPNRPALHARLQSDIGRGPMVLAILDIERFSAINESRGRRFGDELLRQAGQRLCRLVGGAGFVTHPEGDSFALGYRATAPAEVEVERLEGLLQEFEREPFEIGEESIVVDLRAGLALYPDHGEDAESLEHNAMAALTEGGRRGVRIHAFSDELRGRAARRLGMEQDLRRAIDAGEFELFYQPKYEARQQRLAGAEALLRWRHPERGLVSPGEFIPLLENTGLIVPVGRWTMREALATALAWRRRGHPHFRIAVNLSARELRHRRFLEECRDLLGAHAQDQAIDIEITESLLMDDIEHSLHLLDGLRDLGCKVSIDDFGTGYSSLNYLARLPVDEIKIDQSFTALLTQSPETLALVTNIISLAHSLSLRVVAEGVEEEEQAKLLRLLRCDLLQGYWLGRPMPAADFASRLLGDTEVAQDCA